MWQGRPVHVQALARFDLLLLAAVVLPAYGLRDAGDLARR
jgi:hypothetical protein